MVIPNKDATDHGSYFGGSGVQFVLSNFALHGFDLLFF